MRTKGSLGRPVVTAVLVAGASLGCLGGVRAQALDHATAQAKAQALVARMTIEEKLGQLGNTMPAIPRLGVPSYQLWSEGLHGVWTYRPITIFPQAIGMAATFDPALVKQMGEVVASELAAVHRQVAADASTTEAGVGLDVWSPNINIFRDPRWGRGQETYGEDPFLTARMGVAYITGVQGPDPDRPRVIATPKHFAVHSGPEPTRHAIDVKVSLHDLEDTYLPAFRAAVTEAKAGSVMCAYNRINGQPACANDYLIKQRLRGAWGFKGYLVSDCDAVDDIVIGHKYVRTQAEAAAAALKTGLDSDCSISDMMGSDDVRTRYTDAYRQKLISQSDLDGALVRIFTARFELGVAGDAPASVPRARPPQQHAAARRAAQESMVLLKNDGALPLKDAHRIAVVGPLADSEHVLYANYSAGLTDRLVSALEGIRAAFPGATIAAPPGSQVPGDGNTIPSSALRSEDGRPGLTFRVYAAEPSRRQEGAATEPDRAASRSHTKFQQEPRLTEVKRVVNALRFGGPTDPHSIERLTWSGFLVPQESGLYRIGLRTGGGQMSFDGEPLKPGPSDVGGVFTTQRLEKGKRYALSISQLSPGGLLAANLIWKRISESPVEDAVKAAESADVVVAVVGITADLESEESPISLPGFSHGDRTTLELPQDQQQLLQALKATGKKLVVVSMSGSAIDLSWAQENADAVIQAWYPGQEGGSALGDVLAGKVSPSGRLPVTFYRDVAQLPPFDDYAMKGRTYRYFGGKPLYPFGYGLSYTRFRYGAVSVAPNAKDTSKGVRVSAAITNVGARDADEVAQVYLKFPDDPGAPRIALRGFKRLHLRKGETRHVTFALSPRDLGAVSLEGRHQVLAGTYEVSVGGGQPGYAETSKTTFRVSHLTPLPD